jgi:hypothetical protein
MFGDSKELETTASIPPNVAAAHASVNPALSPSEADLAYARAVATEALARGTKDSSHPWENPHSGARGFLASYVKDKSETWLQGEACKYNKGWEVRSLKPWRKA